MGWGWRQDPALHELLVLNLMALLLQDPHPTYTRTDFIVLPFAQGSAQLIPLYLPHSQFMKQKQTHTMKDKQWGQFSAASGLTGEKRHVHVSLRVGSRSLAEEQLSYYHPKPAERVDYWIPQATVPAT